jgi:transmembrane sensor
MSATEAPDRITQEAAEWHARLRREPLSEVEDARFRAWLAGNPARRREFDAIRAMWDQMGALAQSPEILGELQAMSERTVTPADSAEPAAPETPATPAPAAPAAPPAPAVPAAFVAARTRAVSRRALVGWTLAASVVATAGVIYWQSPSAPQLYATSVGEQKTVSLQDGSTVTLNTSSKMSVQFSRRQRRVELSSGQARFTVAKDAARPFIVSAGGGETLAVGTEFDVYQRGEDTRVTLIEGRVIVTSPRMTSPRTGTSGITPPSITLSAGEQVSYSTHSAPQRSKVDLQRASAWRTNKLDFFDTPLSEAIREANRYSKLKIELRGVDLADAKISGVFEAGRNDSVAEAVRAYYGLHLERVGDERIVLSPAR